MDREKLIQRLMTTFLGEIEEHRRALERDLLALDKDSGEDRTELLRTLFRTAHSLKGASRSVNLRSIEAACHELEGILGGLRDGLRPLSPELLQVLFATADALKDAEQRLRAAESLVGSPIEAVISQLELAARGVATAAPAPAPPPVLAPSAAVAPLPAAAAVATGSGFTRISTDKLDALVARSGELLVARRRVTERTEDVAAVRGTLQRCRAEWNKLEKPLNKLTKKNVALPKRATLALERTTEALRKLERMMDLLSSRMAGDHHALEQASVPLEEEIRRLRMVPFADACEGLERVVRDLARAGSKEVNLVLEGADIELDRAVAERLKDPLLHLVRNAVDHGVELPAERLRAGKPPGATITVAAALRGSEVEVVVRDDGRGIDLLAVRDQVRRRKMATPEDDRDIARLVFLPGFSTARLITELSGRGVGLDVVKHRVESLHGHVDFSFVAGEGSSFTLTVPLTLTTIRALLLQAGGQVFALPTTSVRRLVRVSPSDIASVEQRDVLLSNGAPIPVRSLVETLGIPGAERRLGRSGGKVCVVVIFAGERQIALAVDDLLTEQEVVVKNLGARLRRVKHFAGATILPTGRLALILTPADLVESAIGLAPRRSLAEPEDTRSVTKRLLVVDDSVTTRALEKSILEAEGYEVLVAVDGADAWRCLQEKGADLVVSDVEMPKMDGFALCEAIRGSKRFRDLPVILVTALESDQDKARGLEAGADAYLPKSTFDQRRLIETISRLI